MGLYQLILECLLILKLFLKNLQHCDDEEDHIFYVIFDFFCIFADIENDNKFERSLNNDYLTLINAAFFYYYLTRGGRNHLRPQIDPKIGV